MTHEFDPCYASEPFASLVGDYPGADVFPPADFRVEWGPIFHRGRLDGSARLLVLGQDPGQQEAVVRRIFTGEAGQRAQGLLRKVGITRSYVMINTFLYSVYGQQSGEQHVGDDAIAEYRHRWLDGLLGPGSRVEAVIAFGHLADQAWKRWRKTPTGTACAAHYEHLTHPTQPDAASHGDPAKQAQLEKAMLQQWSAALPRLMGAISEPDEHVTPVSYGDVLTPEDHAEIPELDLPAGLPDWMRSVNTWASRVGDTADDKRATVVVTVPAELRPWVDGAPAGTPATPPPPVRG